MLCLLLYFRILDGNIILQYIWRHCTIILALSIKCMLVVLLCVTAVRFYKSLGYIITDEKLDHAGHEDFIMIKELGTKS